MSLDLADNTPPVCSNCIGEPWLKERIRSQGSAENCRYCGVRGKCVTTQQLAGWVRSVLDQHFLACRHWSYYGSEDHYCHYQQTGEPLEEIVAAMVEAELPVVEALMDELSLLSLEPGSPAISYDRQGLYVERGGPAGAPPGSWENYLQELKHGGRVFNTHAKSFLDRLLKDVQSLRAAGRRGTALRVLRPEHGLMLYRARAAQHPLELETLLADFDQQLGPPRPELALPGRLNAAGVSAFYGAFDRPTCIAELRPGLDSAIVSAAFRLLKPVRLLDFPSLEHGYGEQALSYFQPDYAEKTAYRQFLKRLHAKARQPLDGADASEYLCTQVFAEYLAAVTRPRVDGVIYASAQRSGGYNVVLFSHVLDLRPKTEPGAAMGAASAIRIVEHSAQVHRVTAIGYQTRDDAATGDSMRLSLDPDR